MFRWEGGCWDARCEPKPEASIQTVLKSSSGCAALSIFFVCVETVGTHVQISAHVHMQKDKEKTFSTRLLHPHQCSALVHYRTIYIANAETLECTKR